MSQCGCDVSGGGVGYVDRGHSATAATTALFADLSGGHADRITNVFHLIERFYRYVIRHRSTATFFVALNSDGQAEGEPRAMSGKW